MRTLRARFAHLRAEVGEAGMTTIEYAVGMLAAAAFAGLLLKVLTSPKVQAELTALVEKAL